MPPIEVPMMRSGCSRWAMSRSIAIASAGCRGMSSATMVASGSMRRRMSTVPLWADDMKPWMYMIFLPAIKPGYCLGERGLFIS